MSIRVEADKDVRELWLCKDGERVCLVARGWSADLVLGPGWSKLEPLSTHVEISWAGWSHPLSVRIEQWSEIVPNFQVLRIRFRAPIAMWLRNRRPWGAVGTNLPRATARQR